MTRLLQHFWVLLKYTYLPPQQLWVDGLQQNEPHRTLLGSSFGCSGRVDWSLSSLLLMFWLLNSILKKRQGRTNNEKEIIFQHSFLCLTFAQRQRVTFPGDLSLASVCSDCLALKKLTQLEEPKYFYGHQGQKRVTQIARPIFYFSLKWSLKPLQQKPIAKEIWKPIYPKKMLI